MHLLENGAATMAAIEWQRRVTGKSFPRCSTRFLGNQTCKLALSEDDICSECLHERDYDKQREHALNSKFHVASSFGVTLKEFETALLVVEMEGNHE